MRIFQYTCTWLEDCNTGDISNFFYFYKMKFLTVTFLILLAASGFAQADITPKVSDALKRGDAAGIAAYFMPQVDVALPDSEKSLGKADAQKALATFFTQNPVKGFVVKHQGTSKLDDQYRIGVLSTSKGEFRVTFFMRKSGDIILIKQIKIEPEN